MRELIVTLLALTLGGTALDAQVLATRSRDSTTVSVVLVGDAIRAEIVRGGVQSNLNLGTAPTAVVDLKVAPGGAIAIVSEVMGGSIISVIGLDNQLVEFPTSHPALSPDGRFAIFERHYPRNAEAPTEYVLVDVGNVGEDPASRPPFFPGDQNEHVLKSSLQWIDARTFAFLDLDLTVGASRLVVGQVAEAGDISRLVLRELDPSVLVDATKMDIDRVPAAAAISDPQITRLESPGLFLRLMFPTGPAMKVRRLDIQVW